MDKIPFPEWLQEQRNYRNWTQTELARRSRLTGAAISLLESGKRSPGPETVSGLARAFNMPEDMVYRAAGLLPERPDENLDLNEEQWVHLLRQVRPDRREEILEIARIFVKYDEEPDPPENLIRVTMGE